MHDCVIHIYVIGMPNTSTRPKRGRRNRRVPREDPARNELVSRSLESAQQCLFNQDYGTAFVHYLLVLNLAPVLKDFASESFRFTLFKWADELDSLGRIQDLFDCYEQALELFPTDEVIINSMGEHLFRMGFRDEAAGHFHKALKLKPDYPEAKENFYRVANWLVERWHFLMLNDRRRNHKYQQAIQKAVEGGCNTVLDIGTGTGILGVSLVVTETVDAGLFGEGIIESLIHAWNHLLLPPQSTQDPSRPPSQAGRVIPAGATVFGMAVQCLEIRRHHRLCVSEVGGLATAAAGELHSPVSCSSEDDSTEPYTTERLSRLPGGYTPLTEPFNALDIDFNNVQELEGLCSREVSRVRLPVTGEGLLDALAVWFQLHLDQQSSLSTGPKEDTCWEQAIYPVQTPHNFPLRPGDELIVEISCRDAYLRLCSVAIARDGRENNPGPSGNPNPSLNAEAELCSALACLGTEQSSGPRDYTMLECAEMALLNNQPYHDSFRRALAKLINNLKDARSVQGQGLEVMPLTDPPSGPMDPGPDPFYVLDVSEGFSVLSLIAASQGQVKAYSSVEKTQHQAVLRRLAMANGVPEEALEFWLNQVEDEQAVLQRPSREKLWSSIILDCVETCGLVRQKLMEKATLARCLLEDGGQIFPERIVLYGMLVESDTLLLESAVQGQEPTLGFNIAPFINQFTVPVHVFLDLSTLQCRHLSDSVELFILDLMNTNANYTNRDVKVQASASGRVTAVPFWYQIHLNEEISVSTFNQDSHWKQAAVVLHQPLAVREGDWLNVRYICPTKCISITMTM
uniref:Protein arginine N-methyltransferase domain-containing protein n=1 Tax=Oncorhynchus tshawytscha TaxID=74940 RepID=A0A8C8HNG6_ONCTS